MKAALEPFARLEVDASDRNDERVRQILTEMGVTGLPTLIFVARDGTELPFLVGRQSSEAIIAAAHKAARQ